jgi:hypothetical protein
MPRYDSNKSRIENLSGIKPDVSHFVPLYAKGVTHVTREQRQQHGGIVFATKAQSCRLLGYLQSPKIKMANTYIVLINNGVYYRHDCYFEHYQDNPSLLQENLNKRYPDKISGRNSRKS